MATPTVGVSLRDSLYDGVFAGFIFLMHLLFTFMEFLSRTKQTGDSCLIMSQKANSQRAETDFEESSLSGPAILRGKGLIRQEEPDGVQKPSEMHQEKKSNYF